MQLSRSGGVNDAREIMCCLYSPRMRQTWHEAVRGGLLQTVSS